MTDDRDVAGHTDDQDFADHVAGRARWAAGPRGPLALVNTQQVDHAQSVWPVPGQWAPAPGGLTVTAVERDGVLVDGIPVDGAVTVAGDTAVVPSVVVFPDGLSGTVSGSALRVWDPASDAIARFAEIARFERSDAWITSGRYTPVDGQEAPAAVRDAAGDPLVVAGTVETELGGEAVRLLAVRSAVFRGAARLQLIVQDATSALPEDDADSSYSMGRFLYLDDPGAARDVELDWNLLVLPPCAFSYQYACPIPPEDNRIRVRVTAGERHPVDAAGHVLH